MVLRTLHLSGFGIFRDQALPDLATGLNIIEGPNEAGKSTTVEFIRSLLFGFQQGAGKRTYEPLNGGDHGGWAVVRDRNGRDYRWELKARKTPAAGLRSIVEMGRESGIDPAVFLGGADRELYSNVFAFSLDEMAGLKALEKDEVHARIYAAASGGGGISLFTAADSVEKKMADLFRPKAPTAVVNILLQQRKELAQELERLGRGVEAYNHAKQRHAEIDSELAAVREEELSARQAFSGAEAAAAAWELWLDLGELKSELESLAEVEPFPEDGLARLEKSLQALQSHKERTAEVEETVELLTRRLAECRLDQRLLDARDTLMALTERQSEYLNALRDRPTVTHERDRAGQEGAEALSRLGPAWTEERLQSLDRSVMREDEIRAHRDALANARDDVRAQHERLTTADDHLTQRCRQLDEASGRLEAEYPVPPSALSDYAARVHALETAEALFRRSVEQQAELRPLQDRLADLEQRRKETEAEVILAAAPSPWLGIIPLLLCIGVAALGQGNLPLQIGLTVLGLMLCGGWFWLVNQQRSSAASARKRRSGSAAQLDQQHDALEERLTQLQSELDSAAAQSRALLAPFGLTCDTPEAVRQAQRNLAAEAQAHQRYEIDRRSVDSLVREVEAAKDSLDQARRRLEALQEALETAQKQWSAWLQERGLPAEAAPETALRLFTEADHAAAAFRRRDDLTARITAMTAAIESFEADVRALCRELERSEPRPEEIAATLRTLNQEAERQSKLLLQKEELSRRIDEAQTSLARLKESAASHQEAHASLLALAGTESQEAFRLKAQNWARRQALLTRRRELERRLDGISGPGAKREALEAVLQASDSQSLARRCEEAREGLEAVEERRDALQSELGGFANELKRLESADQITSKQRELAAKDAEIAEASEQWAVLRLTSWLIDRTRKKFETERQPAVIKNAGAMMSRLTGGRYSAVVAPEGLAEVALETPQGERKKLEAWSRGTREQLYLALRFAFVQDYNSHSEPLPIIMDDVLVHADGYQRRRLAADTVAEVAKSCQVLYFTCHPDHADLLADACPGAHRYRVESGRFLRLGAAPTAGDGPLLRKTNPGSRGRSPAPQSSSQSVLPIE